MDCVGCSSGAVTERPDLTAQGYRRDPCRDCDQQFNAVRARGRVLARLAIPGGSRLHAEITQQPLEGALLATPVA